MDPIVIALTIFLTTYAFIVFEKGNRAVIALLGAVMMVFLGILEIDKVFTQYIEWHTITLLVGMMILVGITNQSGVFQYLAIKSVKWTKGNPIRTLIMLSLLTAVCAAFLDNVTTVLLIVPITFVITDLLRVNSTPFLLAEVIAANIGGTATLVGDPPNIMIGSANPHLTFNQFILHLAPIVAIILCVTLIIFYLTYRKKLVVTDENRLNVMQLNESVFIKDKRLLKQSMFVLSLTIGGFLSHSVIHLDASVVAIGGATLLMIMGVKKEDVEDIFQEIEWTSIFFFIGLFTLVGGLQEVGIIKQLAKGALMLTGGNIPLTTSLVLWGSGITSAVIDNIPFVATMIPLIQEMASSLGLAINSPDVNTLWWSLALGACLGGNGTIIGASANVIVASLASQKGKGFSYMEFLKVGAPITIISLFLAHIYIFFRYLV